MKEQINSRVYISLEYPPLMVSLHKVRGRYLSNSVSNIEVVKMERTSNTPIN